MPAQKVDKPFLVLDNGAHSMKFSVGSGVSRVPNCIARAKDDRRIFIGHQLNEDKLSATLQYRRSHENGYLVNWQTEKTIWDALFASDLLASTKPESTQLLLTEPYHNLQPLQANCDEMVFEYYAFDSYIRCNTAALIPWGDLPTLREPGSPVCHEVVLVVDSGYSFTHITPVINGVPKHENARRLDIGGKFLTNYLKETVSFRYYDMMEETHLINQIKEKCCFVSNDFKQDMELARNGKLVKKYVLPDFATNTPGYLADENAKLKEDTQLLSLKYELFQIPELLFVPSDVDMKQCGIVQGVMESIKGLSDPVKAMCLANIVLIGGNVKFPGFEERFTTDLRALAPEDWQIRVYMPPDPVTYACECGVRMLAQEQVRAAAVSRAQYQESKKATHKFNRTIFEERTRSNSPQLSSTLKRRESKYDETSDRSDTPRSFSPDTEPEKDADHEMTDV